MPSSRILVQASLIALVAGPPGWASEPADDGVSPVRTELTEGAVEVRVQGTGPTESAARTDALHARDRALVAAIGSMASPWQIQPADDGPPGVWPGQATVDRVRPEGGGFVAELVWRVPDVRPFVEPRDAFIVVVAPRLQPRRGLVVLEVPPGLEGVRVGDVLLDGEGEPDPVAVITDRLDRGKRLAGERDGKRQSFRVQLGAPVREPDVHNVAPTCGPCCHGSKDCGRGWDL